jgi:multidrug resistance efflux pump
MSAQENKTTEPAPPQSPDDEKRGAAAATHPTPPPTAAPRKRRPVLFVLAAVVLFFAGWWLADQFFAYTDNAYITSDIVPVAPEVSGPIVAVHVHDNQLLKAGDLLFNIDPKPFQIAVDQSRAAHAQAQAQIPVDEAQLKTAQASLKSDQAHLQLADIELQRTQKLARSSVIDQQSLDVATAHQIEAVAQLDAAEAAVEQAEGTLHLHERAVATAQAVLSLSEWRLERTEIRAPVDGPVSNLTLRTGNMAIERQPMLTIVDAHAWRVQANYKERFLHHFHPGMKAWVWLDAFPGHWYRAKIEGMSHVIRRAESEPGLVPYVAPTVNWIRLTRRIPVRIELVDPPSNMHLFMGSDARTIVFY